MIWMRTLAASLIACICLVVDAHAVMLGQVDDFQDGTVQGWVEGDISPNPPVNAPNAGPESLDDVLSGVSEMRILASQSSAWVADQVATTLFVDNITAVPEPGCSPLISIAGITLLGARRGRVLYLNSTTFPGAPRPPR